MPGWFVIAVVAAYGMVIGSFLNVLIYRLPREMSVVRPRSHCPRCGALVAWYDNVPVLSFLLLRAKCRHCGARISWRYPLVELAAGALSVAALLRYGVTAVGAEAAVLALMLLPLAVIDLEHKLLPDVLTLPGIALGLIASGLGGLVPLRDAVIGGVIGGAVPYATIVIYRRLRGVEGMGFGDVKFLAMIGAFLGWRGALLTLGLGACLGAIVGIGMIVAGKGRGDTELSFGTFLAVAAAVVLFAGAPMMLALGWVQPG